MVLRKAHSIDSEWKEHVKEHGTCQNENVSHSSSSLYRFMNKNKKTIIIRSSVLEDCIGSEW